MSKEKEPIRSRRQLREQLAQAAGAAGNPSALVRPAPASVDVSAQSSAESVQPRTTSDATVSADSSPAAVGAGAGAPRERESQTRARDRAALRAYKELVDTSGPAPLPSRRALRQAQLDADRAPITSVNPVVPIPGTGSESSSAAKPETKPQPQLQSQTEVKAQEVSASGNSTADNAAASTAVAPAAPRVQPRAGTRSGRRAAATSPRTGYRPTLPGAPIPESASEVPATPPVAAPKSAQGSSLVPKEKLASAATPSEKTSAESALAPDTTETAAQAAVMTSAEADAAQAEALEAIKAAAAAEMARAQKAGPQGEASNPYEPLPGLVPGGDYYPVSAGPTSGAVAPTTEELRVLAAERAEAERAAILAERAQARERLAQESAKNRRPAADPTATNNLAMVTPLEFVEVPGNSRPVLRPPTTTHVPIVTRATPRQTSAGKRIPPRPEPKPQGPALPVVPKAKSQSPSATTPSAGAPSAANTATGHPTVPSVSAERFDAALAARAVHRPGPGNRPLTGGRSGTLKQAEAMATGDQKTVSPAVEHSSAMRSQMPPMPADYAHGLEPLDAVTAGLGRIKRNMLLQWGSIIVGGAAFVAGVIMVITNLAR